MSICEHFSLSSIRHTLQPLTKKDEMASQLEKIVLLFLFGENTLFVCTCCLTTRNTLSLVCFPVTMMTIHVFMQATKGKRAL